jgi:hypothetical protein
VRRLSQTQLFPNSRGFGFGAEYVEKGREYCDWRVQSEVLW